MRTAPCFLGCLDVIGEFKLLAHCYPLPPPAIRLLLLATSIEEQLLRLRSPAFVYLTLSTYN